MTSSLDRWQHAPPVAPGRMLRTVRHDLAVMIVAWFAWLALLQLLFWPIADRSTLAIILAGVAYSLAMCKLLRATPLARPLLTVIPLIGAVGVVWSSVPADPTWPARAGLIAATVTLASLGYFLLALYRFGSGYVFHAPDGSTDGLDTGKLLIDFESVRGRLLARGKLKILFPNTEWENWLRSAFQASHGELTFAELSPENIRKHDLVVPLKIPELIGLDECRLLLADNPIPIPSKACVALCDDKYRLNRALIDNGFGIHVPDMSGDMPYPYVLKKRRDEWAVNSHVISGATQERIHSELLDDPDYFRQKFVPGKCEYTTHILMRDRKIVSALTMKFVFKDDLYAKGRECVATYSKICRNRHLRLFAAMLRSIGFEGLCCINYKIVDGQPRLFEINPRFGASLVPWFFIFLGRALERRPFQSGS